MHRLARIRDERLDNMGSGFDDPASKRGKFMIS